MELAQNPLKAKKTDKIPFAIHLSSFHNRKWHFHNNIEFYTKIEYTFEAYQATESYQVKFIGEDRASFVWSFSFIEIEKLLIDTPQFE